jgi:hypothetical protein
LCIAGDFTRYDEYAVLQIPRNIELLRYRRYGGDLRPMCPAGTGCSSMTFSSGHVTVTSCQTR